LIDYQIDIFMSIIKPKAIEYFALLT
jgi:hypothetical protein